MISELELVHGYPHDGLSDMARNRLPSCKAISPVVQWASVFCIDATPFSNAIMAAGNMTEVALGLNEIDEERDPDPLGLDLQRCRHNQFFGIDG